MPDGVVPADQVLADIAEGNEVHGRPIGGKRLAEGDEAGELEERSLHPPHNRRRRFQELRGIGENAGAYGGAGGLGMLGCLTTWIDTGVADRGELRCSACL